MKSHVLRPLWVFLAVIALTLFVRPFIVPSDFGVGDRGFMYSYHRLSNDDEWKAIKVKYLSNEYCKECHEDQYESNMASKHNIIQCENCHGAAIDHPEDPEMLVIDTSRKLCIRCHSYLPYPDNPRGDINGIDPEEHNVDEECVMCHDPHEPDIEE